MVAQDNVNEIVVPSSPDDSSESLPPCVVTMRETIASPSPDPLGFSRWPLDKRENIPTAED